MTTTTPLHTRLLLLACAALLQACAHTTPTGTYDQIEAELAKADSSPPPAGYEPPPAAASAELLPPIQLNVGAGKQPVDNEERFDIKVNHVPARQFFLGLVKGTPYNMVVHPDVHGVLSLELKNVTVPEVMDTVRDVYGYDFERTDSGYRVFPNTMRSRLFRLDYLKIARSGESKIRVNAGQVSEVVNGENRSGNNNGDRTGSVRSRSISGSQVDTRSESNLWAELEAALRSIVGTGDGRTVVVSPQAGVVLVRAMPDELRAVDRFLSATQQIVERQVILDAKVLEVELSDAYQSGINWSALAESGNSRAVISQIGGGTVIQNGASAIAGNSGVLDPSALSAPVGSAVKAFGGVFSAALKIGGDFTAFIELLKTQGQVHVLSSPRVSTVNNQKAVIKVGSDEFFVTDVRSNTNVTTGALSTQSNVQLTPFFSGVALDVLPQISEDGAVTLHIHPTVSEVREQVKNISVSSTDEISVPLAFSTIRESDTVIRAHSGQVVVIGGLMQNRTEDAVASVPVLGDLPVVGGLFRHTRQVTRKSELVILLRPQVVRGAHDWSAALDAARRHIGEFAPELDTVQEH